MQKPRIIDYVVLGLLAVLLVMWMFSNSSPSQQPNKQQEITDSVLDTIAIRDSLVILAKEEALYYKEISDKMKLKFDSVYAGAKVKLSDIDTLVNTSFESLPDSVKLQYRNKVLDRLKK